MNDLNKYKTIILTEVSNFLHSKGIIMPVEVLEKEIIIKKKKKFNVKRNRSPKKIKFNPKSYYKTFIDICNKYNITYFEYYDENSWVGPAIKVDAPKYDKVKTYFNTLEITTLPALNFYILHPTNKCKNDIIYPKYTNTLEQTSLIVATSDDEDNDDIYNATTEEDTDSEEEIELDEWIYNDNTKYLIDNQNILYSYQTHERIGKKINEFKIEIY